MLMRFISRVTALCLTLLYIMMIPAHGEVPFLQHSSGWSLDDVPLEVSLTAEVSAHMPYDDDRLAMLTPILQMAGMRVISTEDGGSVTITLARNEVLSLMMKDDALQLSCVPGVTYTAQSGAMKKLLGMPATTGGIDLFGLRADAETLLDDGEALLAAIPEAYAAYAKRTKGETNISGMGKAAYRFDFTVQAADAPAMRETLLSICPEGWLKDILNGLTFEGKQTLRAYYTKDDVLLRMEYNGNCGVGDDIRKTNLVWRMRRDDVARKDEITLKTPAKTGSNKNNLSFTRTLQTNKSGALELTGEFSYTVTKDGQTDTRKGDFSLLNTVRENADVLTGAINLRHLPDGDNKYDQYEFEPALTISGTAESPLVSGTLTVREKWGKGVREEAVLHIDLKRAEGFTWPEAPLSIDLDSLTQEELTNLQSGAAMSITRSIVVPVIRLMGEDAAWLFRDMTSEQVQRIIDALPAEQ